MFSERGGLGYTLFKIRRDPRWIAHHSVKTNSFPLDRVDDMIEGTILRIKTLTLKISDF